MEMSPLTWRVGSLCAWGWRERDGGQDSCTTISRLQHTPEALIPTIPANSVLSLHLLLSLLDNFNCPSAVKTERLHFRHAWWMSKQSSKECRSLSHLHVPGRSLQSNFLSPSEDRLKTWWTETAVHCDLLDEGLSKRNTSKDAFPISAEALKQRVSFVISAFK